MVADGFLGIEDCVKLCGTRRSVLVSLKTLLLVANLELEEYIINIIHYVLSLI